MNERSIKRLRRRFVILAMLPLSLVMLLIGGMIFLVNYSVVRSQVKDTLDYIIENDGNIQDAQIIEMAGQDASQGTSQGAGAAQAAGQNASQTDGAAQGSSQSAAQAASDDQMQEIELPTNDYNVIHFLYEIFGTEQYDYDSPEFSFSTRYFAVSLDTNENVTEIKTNHIEDLTQPDAEYYAKYALRNRFGFGMTGVYYYQVKRYDNGSFLVVYLDSTNQVNSTYRVLYAALILIGFGVIVTFIFVWTFSRKAIAPEIKNAELQKSFITNASHELKTPLAVIRANTEMQEMLSGETEWTQSTMRQVDRMSGLIQNLVMISRAREKEKTAWIVTDATKAVRETADTFSPVAKQDGKKLEIRADENVKMIASESDIRQLTSLLVDNAIKYCDKDGSIEVALSQKGKGILLCVSNNYADGRNVDYTRFFERFYREDESHNVDHGGYGIGLSIAESLVESYNGNISVTWKDGVICFNCILK
ncbi:MAG: HAMP domain-containing histidine kinase [Clostridiales bacterium]|nr:HAMP domain-containing histidine kinase [Clostridiales bacterium]